ncbi:hypothetical protein HMN09_00661200 [Mycena chlorophos]|uniref:Uncharacterized protein n=1 Tax=Mycena chlorophos TaxID=658473 RepID=A0A8H6SZ79_MYCCL|nr:hypothetical protein HMN09_00661200 [Mycena chlorophos]
MSRRRTNRAIHLLVAYTINSGMLNMFVAMGCLISWVTSTQTLIYTPYALSLLISHVIHRCSFFFILVHRPSSPSALRFITETVTNLKQQPSLRMQLHVNVCLPSFLFGRRRPPTNPATGSLNSRDYVRNQMHDTVLSTGHAMVSIQYSSNQYTGTDTTVGNLNPGAGVGSKGAGAASHIHAHGQSGSQLESGIAFYPPARKDEY